MSRAVTVLRVIYWSCLVAELGIATGMVIHREYSSTILPLGFALFAAHRLDILAKE